MSGTKASRQAQGALDVRAIARELAANPRVHDWQILKTHTERHELYLIGEATESVRRVDGESAAITLYHDCEGGRGSATLTVMPGGLADLAGRVERAVFMASLAANPAHQLPGPADPADAVVRDAALAERPLEIIEAWGETLRRVAREEPEVRLSAAEFQISGGEVAFLNSQGASFRYPSTLAYLEFVFLSRRDDAAAGPAEGAGGRGAGPAGEPVESENFHSVQVRAEADLDLEAVARERAALARDMLRVSLPGEWTGPVVLDGESMPRLLQPFLARVRADYIYEKVFPTKVGDDIFGGRRQSGDPLDLASDATLPYGLASAPADGEGLPGRRVPLLKAGRVENLLATARLAQYLGVAVTGGAANLVVGAGSATRDDLLAGPVYHLVSFADLRADPLTGDFVSEIRLGYQIGADGKARPVKGGTVSGNVFDAFADCRYSRETVKVGRYFGPSAVRFGKLVISG